MSLVNIRGIELLNNPAKYDDPYNFRIKFEAIQPLAEDLEWRLIYVANSSEENDQELDSCMVGPIPAGVNAFDLTAPGPSHSLLPSTDADDIIALSVILITASYRDVEFVRVGYYINNYYEGAEQQWDIEDPNRSHVVDWERLRRNVLIEKPKVTRFQNPWDSEIGSMMGTSPVEEQSSDPRYLLDNAPLPPPVQKAAPPAQSNMSAYESGIQGEGMEIDVA